MLYRHLVIVSHRLREDGCPIYRGIAGNIIKGPDGFRFLPATTAHKASRKAWPDPKACIPRWARRLQTQMMTTDEMKVAREAASTHPAPPQSEES